MNIFPICRCGLLKIHHLILFTLVVHLHEFSVEPSIISFCLRKHQVKFHSEHIAEKIKRILHERTYLGTPFRNKYRLLAVYRNDLCHTFYQFPLTWELTELFVVHRVVEDNLITRHKVALGVCHFK